MLAAIGRAALLPLWTAQLLTGTKSFARNRVIGSPWLNRHGLHTARVVLAHRVAARRREHLTGLVARHKIPRYVWILDTPLPRNASGKFLKRELRESLKVGDAV